MRERVWSSVLSLVVIACLLFPAALFAADASAATAVDPNNAAASAAPASSGASAGPGSVINPSLVDLLVKKGILTTSEANSLRNTSGSAGMEQLLMLLKAKGVVNDSEAAELKSAAAEAETMHALADTESGPLQTANLVAGQAAQATQPATPAPPPVIPAIAPLRVLPIDPPTKDALKPAFTLGQVRVLPYGFIKATMAYDSYDPTGDDFPRPGFTAADSGPNQNPEFHLKARATRAGSRFEWPDVSKNITITGQIEADFEGNFSRVDNRNVSAIRSNALQLRLAYGRIDWNFSPNSTFFFEAGQNWTIFGSSALMNLFETTFFAAYWGNLYERSPQFRWGLVQKLGGSRAWKISPEFAIMMPSEGNLPADVVTTTCTPITMLPATPTCTSAFTNGLGNQLGYGERQGADAARPTLESRVVLQFQLDKAPGVVPAQILWSGFYTHRQATVLASAVPAAFKSAFPRGVDVTSPGYGNQVAVSLPTRWFTVVTSWYYGGDLRFFFAGQTLSNYTQAGALREAGRATALSVDGSSTVTFGFNAAGNPTVAPQLPVRGYGGFVQVGLPLSRLLNAEAKGRNAGWQAFFEYGLDAAQANDFRFAKGINATTGGGPIKGSLKAATIFYKMNPWVQFGFEESLYRGQALPNTKGVCTTKVAGLPSCVSEDWRTEFGPIFTF
jgi:hypothetical protein